MNKEEIFAVWTPEASLWSTWTKPVLFAHLDEVPAAAEQPMLPDNLNWCPAKEEKVAVVVDLPGADGVLMGAALAQSGYCPVPLYNAIPLPGSEPILDPFTGLRQVVIDVLPIINALRNEAGKLAGLQIPSDAPPVFLLDANRQGDWRNMIAGQFDNRSVCYTTDFPSANFLLAHGFQRALLVQKTGLEPQSDLAHVLRRWQDGNIKLEVFQIGGSAGREHLNVAKPSWYGAMFQRALMSLGLRRAMGGGFGAWPPGTSAVG